MIVAHIMGLPVEETALQFAAVSATTATAVAVGGQTILNRLLKRLRRRP